MAAPTSPRSRAPNSRAAQSNGANLGFEAKLWLAADKLRGNLDSGEYKHVVLGIIFLKYISDAFEEKRQQLLDEPGANPEDRDEYLAENIFWVPAEARWPSLQATAKQPTIGKAIDDAMVAIERDNRRLLGVLPKDYGRPSLDQRRLGELIDLIGTIGLGSAENRSKDILGRVYEYFLGQFATAEGRKGGEFYTPRSAVRLLVEMLAPHENARIYDPCCGSGGMFVQSESFIESHGGRRDRVSVYGQELNHTTWRLCQMNLAIRGIEAHIEEGDTFHADKLKDLKADYVLANPPFNVSDWGGEQVRDDVRWKFGVPPAGNANFAWVQHFVHHLAPTGTAGFVLANGSMSSNQSGEGEIRKNLVEADLVDCMVALPGQLFYSTQIPVCLWFLARNKRPQKLPLPLGESLPPTRSGGWGEGVRDRRGETLFIDARKLGALIDRTHRELSSEEIAHIANTYHAWRSPPPRTGEGQGGGDSAQSPLPLGGGAGDAQSLPLPLGESLPRTRSGGWGEGASALSPPPRTGEGQGGGEPYADLPGFCRSVHIEEIREHGHVLTPGRYVGAEAVEDNGEPFDDKMRRLTAQLHEQMAEAQRLDDAIRKNLAELGFPVDG